MNMRYDRFRQRLKVKHNVEGKSLGDAGDQWVLNESLSWERRPPNPGGRGKPPGTHNLTT